MFGKPQWFREKKSGWGLTPITWQGWTYTAGWTSVLLLPYLAFLTRHQLAEAFIWLAAASGALVWDVRSILIAMRPPKADDVLYIDENETASQQFATRNFDLRLR